VTDERRRSPLAGIADALPRIDAREVPFRSQLALRVDPSATTLALPTEPNTWVADGHREVLWLGPDEWLVVGDVGAAVAETLTGTHHSAVDLSAGRAVFDLTGSRRFDLLAAGCGIDLHPRSWRSGMCAQTLLARIPVLLQERPDATRVFVRTSFAGSLVEWLSVVAAT
jgi:sarcosine oxidase, subunit gamma